MAEFIVRLFGFIRRDSVLDEFKERYIEECIINGRMSEDLSSLFEVIAHEEFGDDPLKMDAFIQSIVDENTEIKPSELDLLKQENEELKQRQEMTEEALLTLSDMLLSR
ncbi:hypothetical protein CXM95_05085 [Enterococcus sp. CR-Ec1]|jgi:hypothetical protein|nr:hypothetical protein CXM95_05085 [Enterococcus sp. CR-Ec1]